MSRLTAIGFCVVMLSLASGVSAADPYESRHKAAMELLEATSTPQLLDDAISKMLDMQVKANPDMARFRVVMEDFFKKYMSWASLKDEFARIYAEEFTTKELNEMTAFYRTPTGRKMAQKLPVLMEKGMELGQRRVQENMTELQQAIVKELEKDKQ